MANKKYDNLVPLMASGNLAWPRDKIMAVLLEGAVYEGPDQRLQDVAGTERSRVSIPGRAVGPTGTLLGAPATFPMVQGNINYAVVVVKDDGTGNPWLISFYDSNDSGQPIKINVPGSLTVRPLGSVGETPGEWVKFS